MSLSSKTNGLRLRRATAQPARARKNCEDVQQGADALAICTGWPHFRAPDFDTIKSSLNHPLIFHGRNLYDPAFLEILGI
ncbi:MAG TPA: hypothetical protein DCS33_02090 [Gammaproteobacteria bacterium]|nr:hypothetical protein [Gammaproteobacteria bacterium]MBT7227701.1 hypothetical protein [Gammaproteobacteria bacterium]HAS48085.1 hypothetical protein [Gammaproteobacteria bacterium]